MSLPDRTLLAVPVTAADTASARRQILSAQSARADVLEFRLDLMANADWAALLAEASLPVIATLRPKDQGGEFTGSEDERLELLKKIAQAKPAFIDFEWPHFAASARARETITAITSDRLGDDKPALIMSFHDFDKVPANLADTFAAMSRTPAAVLKAVCFAQSIQDNFPLFDLVHCADRPSIILAMGAAGQISRVLAAKLGTFLTFSCLSAAESSAPGQISIDRLHSLYNWDRINTNISVYGVLGFPVGHSLSPAIHNASFENIGFDGLYLPFLIEPDYEHFTTFMDSVLSRPWLDLRGLSVTIPHKENSLRYLREHDGSIDPAADRIGCANTIVISPDAKLSGYNADLDGALDALTAGMRISRRKLRRREIAVLGAGGAARAVVAGLTELGAKVAIYNRTAERAQRLADEFGATAVPLPQLARTSARIIINCTSLGMHPNVDDSPFPSDSLTSDMVVFDTVYNPLRTRLLTDAATAGAKTISGADMLINQAAAQFRLWTANPAPTDLMHQVLKNALL